MLERFSETHFKTSQIPCRIFTFGFGFDLDSKMLSEIATAGHGAYNYIPTAAMVGTVFVNAISNIRTTMGTNAIVKLNVPVRRILGYDTEKDVKKRARSSKKSTSTSLRLGTLYAGQSRTVMFDVGNIENKKKIEISCSYFDVARNSTINLSSNSFTPYDDKDKMIVEKFRLNMVALLETISKNNPSGGASDTTMIAASQALVRQFLSSIEEEIKDDERLSDEHWDQLDAMQADLEGEISLALTLDHYKRWGKHYLLSMYHAHKLELCNNFKDKSVEFYGGELFKKLRSKGDDVFCSLPPPKPSLSKTTPTTMMRNATQGSASSTNRSLNIRQSYYNSRAPCFSGESLIMMANGTHNLVSSVRPGDSVRTSQGSNAVVRFVVKTSIRDGKTNLVTLSQGLRITPFHPVRVDDTWCFPADIANVKMMPCDAVYSFVLKEMQQSLCIGGFECASLGHGETTNTNTSALAHPYFGNRDKIIQDLLKVQEQQDSSDENGMVHLREGSCVKRDPITGLICGLGNFD